MRKSRFWGAKSNRDPFINISLGWAGLVLGVGIPASEVPTAELSSPRLGEEPKPRDLKVARIVGYMGLFFGSLLLLEMAFGLLN